MEIMTKKEQTELLEKFFGELQKKIDTIENRIAMLQAPEKMLNRAEVAGMLGITYHQVAQLSYEKSKEQSKGRRELPYIRVGRSILYKHSDVLAVLERIKS